MGISGFTVLAFSAIQGVVQVFPATPAPVPAALARQYLNVECGPAESFIFSRGPEECRAGYQFSRSSASMDAPEGSCLATDFTRRPGLDVRLRLLFSDFPLRAIPVPPPDPGPVPDPPGRGGRVLSVASYMHTYYNKERGVPKVWNFCALSGAGVPKAEGARATGAPHISGPRPDLAAAST